MSRCWPSTQARAAPAARCSATARADRGLDAADPSVLDPLDRTTGERLGGLAWPTTRPPARWRRHRRGGRRDRRRRGRPRRDRCDVANTVAVVVQPRQRRRAAVPEVRDDGDPRRARRHQGRPWAAGDARRRRDLGASLRSLGSRSTPVLTVPPRCHRLKGIEDLLAAALTAPRRRPRPWRSGGCSPPGRLDPDETSSPSAAHAGCARWAAVRPRSTLLLSEAGSGPGRRRASSSSGREVVGADDGA